MNHWVAISATFLAESIRSVAIVARLLDAANVFIGDRGKTVATGVMYA